MSDKKLTKSMPEVKLAISTRIRSLVDETAATIKDLHQRELFKSSVLGEAHPEPGTHEPAMVGVPEHMEPGMHEQTAQPAPEPPVGDSAPTSAALGVPGGDLAPENGTVDLCPLCMNPDTPETCTCLGDMAKNEIMGYGAGTPNAMGMGPQAVVKAEACKKCSGMHKPLDKCGQMTPAKSPVKKAIPPMDPKASSNKPNQGQTLDQRAGLSGKATANARSGPRKNPLSKAVDSPATIPDPKAKALPKEKVKAVTGAGGQKNDKVKDNEKGLKKGDVPMAKPPSGKVPGGTQAPPMSSTTSKPGVGAAPKAPKPPPAPGMAKAALPPNAKQQMQQHMLNDAAKKPAAPAGKPPAMPGHLQGFLDEKQNRPATMTSPTNMGRANDLQSQIPGGSFQPPPAPKLQGMKPPPAPAQAAPKRSLFGTLFGGKK